MIFISFDLKNPSFFMNILDGRLQTSSDTSEGKQYESCCDEPEVVRCKQGYSYISKVKKYP